MSSLCFREWTSEILLPNTLLKRCQNILPGSMVEDTLLKILLKASFTGRKDYCGLLLSVMNVWKFSLSVFPSSWMLYQYHGIYIIVCSPTIHAKKWESSQRINFIIFIWKHSHFQVFFGSYDEKHFNHSYTKTLNRKYDITQVKR